MSEPIATASAPETKPDAQAAAPAAAAPASDQKPAAAAPAADSKPAADAKPATDAKPADDGKAKSPVSTQKPTSLISDAGKAQPNADGTKKEGDAGDGKKDDANKDGKKDEPAKAGVPEKYDIKVPEGMTLDQAKLEKFTPIAQKLGLSNEQAQELASFYATDMAEMVKVSETRQADDFKAFCENTLKETTDFYGSKLEAVLPFVARGRDNFANDGVIAKLEMSGLSNDKDFMMMFEKMGRSVSEDKLVDGKRDTGKDQRTPGSIIYGKEKT